MRTPKEARQQLKQALLSNEYTQGYGSLEYIEDENIYNCVLGVACREAMKDGIELITRKLYQSRDIYFDDYGGILPPVVSDWLGFKTPTGKFRQPVNLEGIKSPCNNLINANDWHVPFEKLAELIDHVELTGE